MDLAAITKGFDPKPLQSDFFVHSAAVSRNPCEQLWMPLSAKQSAVKTRTDKGSKVLGAMNTHVRCCQSMSDFSVHSAAVPRTPCKQLWMVTVGSLVNCLVKCSEVE
jgi:hypothetical protein